MTSPVVTLTPDPVDPTDTVAWDIVAVLSSPRAQDGIDMRFEANSFRGAADGSPPHGTTSSWVAEQIDAVSHPLTYFNANALSDYSFNFVGPLKAGGTNPYTDSLTLSSRVRKGHSITVTVRVQIGSTARQLQKVAIDGSFIWNRATTGTQTLKWQGTAPSESANSDELYQFTFTKLSDGTWSAIATWAEFQ